QLDRLAHFLCSESFHILKRTRQTRFVALSGKVPDQRGNGTGTILPPVARAPVDSVVALVILRGISGSELGGRIRWRVSLRVWHLNWRVARALHRRFGTGKDFGELLSRLNIWVIQIRQS